MRLGRAPFTGFARPAFFSCFYRVLKAEAVKQRKGLYAGKMGLFITLLWPLLHLTTAYYAYKPFMSTGMAVRWPLAATPQGVLLFLATGMLGHRFFWSLAESAWQFSMERTNGTLELIFLTPVNRLALIMANSLTVLLRSTAYFLAFMIGLVAIVGGLNIANPGMVLVSFFGLLIPAVAWGALLNSVFVFSRDATILYSIADEPQSFLAGVRVPTAALPFFSQVLGVFFPLTTSLSVLRGVLLEGATLQDLRFALALLLGLSALMLGVAQWLLYLGEKRARETGSLTLF